LERARPHGPPFEDAQLAGNGPLKTLKPPARVRPRVRLLAARGRPGKEGLVLWEPGIGRHPRTAEVRSGPDRPSPKFPV